ncbi:TPA: bifunctional pyr operon transcriptional regulator/uracil phosphoribosyltransferase PyrR [bacterium]|nr:MAG: hypothetical protein AUJ18_03550 [Candidatus Hydrogenedentes bacterium CG1_02_42_14]PIU47476.1 MAG: bifunctional pyr operon transcriptional regulator/uracil phosphoribosyltransferase PyrR [Candidatus Hydrogenedentes bacterium CG07_land_8_20_14_0_80_42_17]HBW47056.1 bifunctional pyr operon transcriptional regulator/uracil phosphoribosyltransferase PyrR [bacterium]
MNIKKQVTLLDKIGMEKAIGKIGADISKRLLNENIAFVGIQTRGVPFAKRLSEIYSAQTNKTPAMGRLDITLYRDDLNQVLDWPVVKESEIDFKVEGKTIILVDDVLFTGRTVRAALNALSDYGRPKCVKLAVLVDRGHRELPIEANYFGMKIETSPLDYVSVLFNETDGKDEVKIIEQNI